MSKYFRTQLAFFFVIIFVVADRGFADDIFYQRYKKIFEQLETILADAIQAPQKSFHDHDTLTKSLPYFKKREAADFWLDRVSESASKKTRCRIFRSENQSVIVAIFSNLEGRWELSLTLSFNSDGSFEGAKVSRAFFAGETEK